jgi:hypothetical protein
VRTLAILLVTCPAIGCSTIGARTLPAVHSTYNENIVHTLNDQLLLNLVRLRYRDNPYFLEVGSITSQQTLTSSAGIGATVVPTSDATKSAITPSLGVSWSISPTVVLAPLQGEAFLQKLLARLPLATVLTFTQGGWSISRVLSLAVDRLNGVENAPSASGPTPAHSPSFRDFKRLLVELHELWKAGLITVGVDSHSDPQHPDVVLEVRATPEQADRITRVKEQLGLAPNQSRYHLTTDFLERDPEHIALQTRSVLSVMFYLSNGVRPPGPHADRGLVTVTRNPDGTPFDWDDLLTGLFRVEETDREPGDAYVKVHYRGRWFYIRDTDLESKSTFMLLTELFAMQAGQVSVVAPTLTIPAGH